MTLPTLAQPTDDTELLSEQRATDLRGLNAENQTSYLLWREEQMRSRGRIDAGIYLLRGNADEVLNGLGEVEAGLHDIDGTHTTVGGHRLFDQNIRGLKAMNETGVQNFAVTGRHLWQVEELIDNHPKGTGFNHDQWLTEQGFFIRTGKGQVEYFEGTAEIEDRVAIVREKIDPILRQLEAAHGIRFETTSLRDGNGELYPHAHKTMFSVDAHRGTSKITDSERALHDEIMTILGEEWVLQDPNNMIAKLGTSSTGTFEFTPDGLDKEGSVRALINRLRIPYRSGLYLGDSGNDVPVFRNIPDLRKGVIVNPHTKQSLIEKADIATVGIGNAGPIMEAVTRARRKAETIQV